MYLYLYLKGKEQGGNFYSLFKHQMPKRAEAEPEWSRQNPGVSQGDGVQYLGYHLCLPRCASKESWTQNHNWDVTLGTPIRSAVS